MWGNKKSTRLSLIVTYLFIAIVLLVALFGPRLVSWFLGFFGRGDELKPVLLWAIYLCAPAAIIALLALRMLLVNILNENIFVAQNTLMLRILSWCCFLAAAVTLVLGFLYLPFILVSVAAAFMALILRVVKNVISAAVEIKQENDMTI